MIEITEEYRGLGFIMFISITCVTDGEGKAVHSENIKKIVEMNLHLNVSLLKLYTPCVTCLSPSGSRYRLCDLFCTSGVLLV